MLILPTHLLILNVTYLPLALSSATFHSRLKTELFKISYPDSTSAPPHVRHSSPITTVASRCLLGLTFSDFDQEPKRNEKFGYCELTLVWHRWI